jgi:dTDP-4-amino-4,6-dideoxygalactose transaminase
MGVSQDESLNHRLKLRETIGHIYEEAVKKSRNTMIPVREEYPRIYADFPVIIKSNVKEIIAYLKKNGVEAIRPYPFCLHHYLNLPKEKFQVTEYVYLNTLLVPLYSGLMKKEVELISKLIATML